MKKNTIIAGVLALAGIFTGCNKEMAPEVGNGDGEMVTIRLSTNAAPEILDRTETKTMLSGTEVHWKTDDKIWIGYEGSGVFYGVLENKAANGEHATFEGNIHSNCLSKTCGVIYPYQENIVVKYKAGQPCYWESIDVPSEQTLTAGTFDGRANVSIAAIDMTSQNSLNFTNVTGLIEFQLKGNSAINKVEIKCPRLAYNSGPVSASGKTPWTLEYSVGENSTVSITSINYNGAANTSQTITLTSDTPIQLTEEYQKFYACLMPYSSVDSNKNDMYNNYTITVTRVDGTTASVTKNMGTKFVQSGMITPVTRFEVNDPVEVPVERPEILYLQTHSNWAALQDGKAPRFAAAFFKESGSFVWVNGTFIGNGNSSGDIDKYNAYAFETPGNEYPNVIFCRMDSTNPENNIDNAWTRTIDITIPTDGTNMVTTKWDGTDDDHIEWSAYSPLTRLYLSVLGSQDNWMKANEFRAKFYNNAGEFTVVDMTLDSEGIYTCNIPEGYPSIEFQAMNPDNSGSVLYTSKKTAVRTDKKDLFTVDNYNNGAGGKWSTK